MRRHYNEKRATFNNKMDIIYSFIFPYINSLLNITFLINIAVINFISRSTSTALLLVLTYCKTLWVCVCASRSSTSIESHCSTLFVQNNALGVYVKIFFQIVIGGILGIRSASNESNKCLVCALCNFLISLLKSRVGFTTKSTCPGATFGP